jgi:hypothetical protein
MAQSYKEAMQIDKRQIGRSRRLIRQQAPRGRCDGPMVVYGAGTALLWSSLQSPRSPAHSTTPTGTPVARAHDRVLLGATAARASGNPLAAMPCASDRSVCGFDESEGLTALKVTAKEH